MPNKLEWERVLALFKGAHSRKAESLLANMEQQIGKRKWGRNTTDTAPLGTLASVSGKAFPLLSILLSRK